MPSALPDLKALSTEAATEREQLEGEIREIDVLVKQNTSEVDRLQQRQADAASRLRQIEANLEAYPREEIKSAYLSGQDVQLRLFMMRSQLEQLQNKQRQLQRYRNQLDRLAILTEQLGEASGSVVLASGENGRLLDKQSMSQIIEAQELERQHLARQMHDGPAQSLTNLILQAEIVERCRAEVGDQAADFREQLIGQHLGPAQRLLGAVRLRRQRVLRRSETERKGGKRLSGLVV